MKEDVMKNVKWWEEELLKRLATEEGFTEENVVKYNELCELKENLMKHAVTTAGY